MEYQHERNRAVNEVLKKADLLFTDEVLYMTKRNKMQTLFEKHFSHQQVLSLL